MKKSQKKIVNAAVFVLLAYFVTRPMYYPGVGDNPNRGGFRFSCNHRAELSALAKWIIF